MVEFVKATLTLIPEGNVTWRGRVSGNKRGYARKTRARVAP